MPRESSVGELLPAGDGKLSCKTTTGNWYSPSSCSRPPRIVKWQSWKKKNREISFGSLTLYTAG
jgi:hypothetical protein